MLRFLYATFFCITYALPNIKYVGGREITEEEMAKYRYVSQLSYQEPPLAG